MKAPKFYRHGDLLIRRIEKIENETRERKQAELTVALGEATGHHHTLYPNPGVIVKGFTDKKYFEALGGIAELRHQEHKTLKIDPGAYEIVYEREHDYFDGEIKKVKD